MRVDLFDFELPDSCIATKPSEPRDAARMLVVNDGIIDDVVRNLVDYLRPEDCIVFNNTRVFPARLRGLRGAAKVELLLHKKYPLPTPPPERGRESWKAFAKPAAAFKIGDVIHFAEDFSATVLEKLESGEIIIQMDSRLRGNDNDIMEKIERYREIPLPPYIEKQRKVSASDTQDYQTIYATHMGSVAAPTAGLHFTEALLARIDALGCARAHVTLHVGAATFQPVKVKDTREHTMHSEWAEVSQATADSINAAKSKGGRVIAVGTTSARTLESATDDAGRVHAFSGETDIFITPSYQFKCVDVLMTNFHLPKSTLFMLVSAFSGLEQMHAAYAHAIENNYRFYSYGDACLLFLLASAHKHR